MLARCLDLPNGVKAQAVLPLGYADERVPESPRYGIETITFLENWNNRIENWDDVFMNYSKVFLPKLKHAAKKLVTTVSKKWSLVFSNLLDGKQKIFSSTFSKWFGCFENALFCSPAWFGEL